MIRCAQKIRQLFWLLAVTLAMSACADRLMVPGGDRQVNEHIYENKQDFLNRVGRLEKWMTEKEVFGHLNVEQKDVIRMDREEILTALYGDHQISMQDFEGVNPAAARQFLQQLYGYKLRYQDLEREHGFKHVIRYRTKEEGFDYEVIVVFHNGRLFEKPMVTGGAVKNSSSVTIFDGVRFGTFIPWL
jgi:hypothetical protein